MARLFVLLLCLSAVGFSQSTPTIAQSAFQKMKALTGNWSGKDAEGNAVRTSFKPMISGTALMETLSPSGMEEMLSLYTVDGDGIQLAHYCPTNNQPRMRAVPSGPDPKELDFQFTGAGNLPDISVGHQHRMLLQIEDANHITETWTWKHGNHEMPMVFHLVREK